MNGIIANVLRSMQRAFWRVLRAGLVGLIVGFLAVEGAGFWLSGGWPPHTFTHVAAGTFAVLLAYSAIITVALSEIIRGLVAAADQAADSGLDVLDAIVDTVDGPDRHGFRGKRSVAR